MSVRIWNHRGKRKNAPNEQYIYLYLFSCTSTDDRIIFLIFFKTVTSSKPLNGLKELQISMVLIVMGPTIPVMQNDSLSYFTILVAMVTNLPSLSWTWLVPPPFSKNYSNSILYDILINHNLWEIGPYLDNLSPSSLHRVAFKHAYIF